MKALGGVIDALKGRPEFVMLLALNLIFIVLGYWFVQHQMDRNSAVRIQILERCVPNREKI